MIQNDLPADWDVIVVGAGIAGASVASELAATKRVLLLEREEQPGSHATARSAAVFIEPYGNHVVQALTAASRPFFFDPPAGFSEVPLVSDRELFQVASGEQEELLRDGFAELSPRFPHVSLVDGPEVEARVPLLRSGRIKLAMYDPRTQDIDVDALLRGFLRVATRRGAQLLKSAEVVSLERRADLWEAMTAAGRFRAPLLVNAAGAWADSVARLAGVSPLGLRPLRRSMFVVDPGCDTTTWPLIADVGEEWYFKPDGGRLLVSPSEEDLVAPCDAAPDELTIAMAVDRLQQVLDLEVRHLGAQWAGLRTFASDGSPVVGFEKSAEGFFWLAGQGGFGIQTSPTMARLASALLQNLPVPDDLLACGISGDAVRPERLTQ